MCLGCCCNHVTKASIVEHFSLASLAPNPGPRGLVNACTVVSRRALHGIYCAPPNIRMMSHHEPNLIGCDKMLSQNKLLYTRSPDPSFPRGLGVWLARLRITCDHPS